MRINISALAGVVFILSSVQSATAKDQIHWYSAVQHKTHANHNTGFVKPGAAVALSHDYDGKTGLGELETLSARLSHIYQDGSLSVALLSAPDIQISAFTAIQNMPVYQGSTLDLPIQFSSAEPGNFTLSLETVYKGPDGRESRRVLSIPVNIGVKTFDKSPVSDNTELNTAKKSGLIGFAAIEVIE